jgi:poly(3-hydroxybutyrate) depolymerase
LATQWRALHGLTTPATTEPARDGVRHQVWPSADRHAKPGLVELWSLPHLPHAYPAGTRIVPPGRYVEQAPVDATTEIARFFGLD